MKKILYSALFAGILTSCNLIGGGSENVDAIPFQSSEDGRWGMIKNDGTILFDEEFKSRPTLSFNNRFCVKNSDNQWEIYTTAEKPEKVGDEYTYIGGFKYGVAPSVKKGERIKLIDTDGGTVATLEKSGGKNIMRCGNFSHGYALILTEDAVGIINTKGETIVEAKQYYLASILSESRFLVIDKKYANKPTKEQTITILDSDGKEVNKIKCTKYDEVTSIKDCPDLLGVVQRSDSETRVGLIDLNGEVIVKPSAKIKVIGQYRNGNFIVSDGENCGLMSREGEMLIRAKYDNLTWASDDLLWAYKKDGNHTEATLIDTSDNDVSKDSYLLGNSFYDGSHAFVRIAEHEWAIVNIKGEEQKDIKTMNDVYNIDASGYDDLVYSDFIDIDAIVSYFNMSKTGMGDFNMTMTVPQMLKVYNEKSGNNLDAETNYMEYKNLFEYIHTMEGAIEVKVKVTYSEGIGEQKEDGTYAWKNILPETITLDVPCGGMKDKQREIFSQLTSKAKAQGTLYKENKNACIVNIDNKYGIVVALEGDDIYAFMCDASVLENIDISGLDESDTSNAPQGQTTESYSSEQDDADYGNTAD